MSFGYSVSDLVRLGQYAYSLYQACDSSSDIFRETAHQCLSIYIATGQTQRELLDPNFSQDQDNYEAHVKLSALTTSCRATLNRLERILGRYKSLGTSVPRTWDTMRFAVRLLAKADLGDIRSQLILHLVALNVFLTTIKNDTLGKIERRLSDIAANVALISMTSGEQISKATISPGSSQPSHSATQSRAQSLPPYTQSSLKKAMKIKAEKLQNISNSNPDLSTSVSLLSAAQQMKLALLLPTYHYSKSEEWLSGLPEGWQRTMVNANSYQYRYLLGSKDIRSRTYDLASPFETTLAVELDTLPSGWVENAKNPRRVHYYRPATGDTQFQRPLMDVTSHDENHIVGWVTHNGLPLDLNDVCSLELARDLIVDKDILLDDIKGSLPRGWQCCRNDEGRLIYNYLSTKDHISEVLKTTVHPAFFSATSKKSMGNSAGRLPPGWDIRLDTWGNVFYVDHNTATAQRVHPKADPNVNYVSGLPHGWTETRDHNGARYFYETTTLKATYQGSLMKSDTSAEKFTLDSVPISGNIPPIKSGELSPRGGLQRDEVEGIHSLLNEPPVTGMLPLDQAITVGGMVVQNGPSGIRGRRGSI